MLGILCSLGIPVKLKIIKYTFTSVGNYGIP